MAGTEIIDSQTHTECADRFERFHRPFGIFHHRRFGELDIETVRIDSMALQCAVNDSGQVSGMQLLGRQIDGNRAIGAAETLECRKRLAGFVDRPFAQRNDQIGLFGQGDELAGGLHLAVALPAHQRLETHQLPIPGRELRLEMHRHFAPLERLAQAAFHVEPVGLAFGHRRIKQDRGVTAIGGRNSPCMIGMGDPGGRVDELPAADMDTDRGAKKTLATTHQKGLIEGIDHRTREAKRGVAVGEAIE